MLIPSKIPTYSVPPSPWNLIKTKESLYPTLSLPKYILINQNLRNYLSLFPEKKNASINKPSKAIPNVHSYTLWIRPIERKRGAEEKHPRKVQSRHYAVGLRTHAGRRFPRHRVVHAEESCCCYHRRVLASPSTSALSASLSLSCWVDRQFQVDIFPGSLSLAC